MARRSGKKRRITRRCSLDFSPEISEMLDWLEPVTGAVSTSHVIRKSLELYVGLGQEVKAGGQVFVARLDGRTLFVVLPISAVVAT